MISSSERVVNDDFFFSPTIFIRTDWSAGSSSFSCGVFCLCVCGTISLLCVYTFGRLWNVIEWNALRWPPSSSSSCGFLFFFLLSGSKEEERKGGWDRPAETKNNNTLDAAQRYENLWRVVVFSCCGLFSLLLSEREKKKKKETPESSRFVCVRVDVVTVRWAVRSAS